MILRHAIMQTNYYVRIRTVLEEEVDEYLVPSPARRWVRLRDLGSLPLTGLTRKVLIRAKLTDFALIPESVSGASNSVSGVFG